MAHTQYCIDFDFTHLKDRELGSFSPYLTTFSFCFVTFQIACSFLSEKASSFSHSAESPSDSLSPSTSRCRPFLSSRSPQASGHRDQSIARNPTTSRDDQLRSPADDLPKWHSAANRVRIAAEDLRVQSDPGEALPLRRGAGSAGSQSVLVEQQAGDSKEGGASMEPPADQGNAQALREEERFPAEPVDEGDDAGGGEARRKAGRAGAALWLLLLWRGK